MCFFRLPSAATADKVGCSLFNENSQWGRTLLSGPKGKRQRRLITLLYPSHFQLHRITTLVLLLWQKQKSGCTFKYYDKKEIQFWQEGQVKAKGNKGQCEGLASFIYCILYICIFFWPNLFLFYFKNSGWLKLKVTMQVQHPCYYQNKKYNIPVGSSIFNKRLDR